MCFVLPKSVCILLKNFLFSSCFQVIFILSSLVFCKLLELNRHFLLKIDPVVCDGVLSLIYLQTLRLFCVLLAFLTFKSPGWDLNFSAWFI
jgi:hypothetical protein